MQKRFEIFGIDGKTIYAGKNYQSREAAEAAKTADASAVFSRLGREWTHSERDRGMVAASRDHRKPEQQILDRVWQPKTKAKAPLTPKEKALQYAIEQRDANRLAKMDPDDRLVFIAQQELDRETDAVIASEKEAEHLERVKDDLQRVETLYDAERWSPNADQGFRDLLQMADKQLRLVDGDRVESKRLLNRINAVLEERRIAELHDVQQRRAALLETEMFLKQESKRLGESYLVSEIDEQRSQLEAPNEDA